MNYTDNKPLKRLAILGCGWLGLPLGSRLVQQGYSVAGSTRQTAKLPLIRAQGMAAFLLDLDEEKGTDATLAQLLQADILLLNIPPGRRRPDVASWYPATVKRVIAAARAQGVAHLLFTSSTGIYGGAIETAVEDQPPQPSTDAGRALLAAEAQVRDYYGERATILRLAGLVGPGRHPGRWFAGKTAVAGGGEPVNLVHLTDVIGCIEAVLERAAWGETLNICADEHPSRADFYTAATRALDQPLPTFTGGEEGVKGKYVDNSRSKSRLEYQYYYPDPLRFPEVTARMAD